MAVIDGESHGFNLAGTSAKKMLKSLRSRSRKRTRPTTTSTQNLPMDKCVAQDALKEKIKALKASKRVSHTYLSSNKSASML